MNIDTTKISTYIISVVILIAAAGVALYLLQKTTEASSESASVEFNLARLSPEGGALGYAVPASGSSNVCPGAYEQCEGENSVTCFTVCPPVLLPPPVCSIDVAGCDITSVGGYCDSPASWTAQSVLDNVVKIYLVWPNGYEDLWSRYRWSPLGLAPAYYSGWIHTFTTPGIYTAKVVDKNNVVCATDTFTVTQSSLSCPSNQPYVESNYGAIRQYCNALNGGPSAGMTYPSTMSCNAAPGWQPYGPTCTSANCDCTYVLIPPNPKPNLESVPNNFAVIKNGLIKRGSETFLVNEEITFMATVKNVGLADALAPYFNRFELSSDGGTTWGGQVGVDFLGATLGQWPNGPSGGARNELTRHTFTNPGTYIVRHCVDVTDVVDETTNADNCSPPINHVILTITIPPTTGTGVVQGYHVNQNIQQDFGTTIISTGAQSVSGNPYALTGLVAGSHTITSAVPSGRTVHYCVHSTTNSCGLSTSYTAGNSVVVNVLDGGVVDLWWMYRPISFAVTFEGSVMGANDWKNPVVINPGEHVDLRWNSPTADTCNQTGSDFDTLTAASGQTSLEDGVLNEPGTISNPSTIPRTYSLRCSKAGNLDQLRSVTVSLPAPPAPLINFGAKTSFVRAGQPARLWWNVTAGYGMDCTLTGDLSSFNFLHPGGTTSLDPHLTNPLTNTQIFTLSCETRVAPIQTYSRTVRVQVIPQVQEI